MPPPSPPMKIVSGGEKYFFEFRFFLRERSSRVTFRTPRIQNRFPRNAPTTAPMMDRIPSVPRARLFDERHRVLRGELRETMVERRGAGEHLVVRHAAVGKADAQERAIETWTDRVRVRKRHQRERDLLTTRPKSSQSETNPLQNLVHRRVVKQIVANVGEQRTRWQPRRVFPLFPKSTRRDPRQHSTTHIAERTVRAPVSQRGVNVERNAAQLVQHPQDRAKRHGEIARPEQDDLLLGHGGVVMQRRVQFKS